MDSPLPAANGCRGYQEAGRAGARSLAQRGAERGRRPAAPVRYRRRDRGPGPEIADVYRAIQIHETAAGQLTIDGIKAGLKLDDTPSLLRQPSVDHTLAAFVEQAVVSLATTGNAFWRKTRSTATGQVSNLEPLNPHLVTVYESRPTFRGPGKITYLSNVRPHHSFWRDRYMLSPGLR